MDSNARTLAAYERKADAYIAGTQHEMGSEFKYWIDQALSLLPVASHVLELGSAFGRDAKYMEGCGYHVDRTDATFAFVEYLGQCGYPVRLLNAITDDLGGPYDMVFANAVFLHFTREELEYVLRKVHRALNDGGILAFSVKAGEGSEWTDEKLSAPRFFRYWQAGPLRELLEAISFRVEDLTEVATDKTTWLHVIARKAG